MRNLVISVLGVAVALLTGNAAFAHHSYAMFDIQKTVTVQGTIKSFEWTNPHSWVELTVKDPGTGANVDYWIESGSPKGENRHNVSVGDLAMATLHPLKDGHPGGQMLSLTINGKEVIGGARGRPAGAP